MYPGGCRCHSRAFIFIVKNIGNVSRETAGKGADSIGKIAGLDSREKILQGTEMTGIQYLRQEKVLILKRNFCEENIEMGKGRSEAKGTVG